MSHNKTLDRHLAHDGGSTRREAVVLRPSDWASTGHLWKGVVEGTDVGTDVTVLFFTTEEIGEGPRLHVHPYDEVFIVRSGRARFTIGDQTIVAQAGDILLGPANVPHKFHNLGPGVLETTDIHLSKQWIQTNLSDPAEPHKLEPQSPTLKSKVDNKDKSNAKNQINRS